MNKYGRMRQDGKPTPRLVQMLNTNAGYIKYNKQKFAADKLIEIIDQKVIVKPFGLNENQLEVCATDGNFICIAMNIKSKNE